jgi:hypothetical protein
MSYLSEWDVCRCTLGRLRLWFSAIICFTRTGSVLQVDPVAKSELYARDRAGRNDVTLFHSKKRKVPVCADVGLSFCIASAAGLFISLLLEGYQSQRSLVTVGHTLEKDRKQPEMRS